MRIIGFNGCPGKNDNITSFLNYSVEEDKNHGAVADLSAIHGIGATVSILGNEFLGRMA
jgi:hypothetical protein